VESLPARKKARVKDDVIGTQGKLPHHFLPGYASDLSPDELVWSRKAYRRCETSLVPSH
jgi:hypothetical protein